MDDIQKLTKGIGSVLAKIFSGKQAKGSNFFYELSELEPEEMYAMALNYIEAKELSKAEDFLFESMSVNPNEFLYNGGLEIVENLLLLNNSQIKELGYTKEELLSWQSDWIALKPEKWEENLDSRVAPNFPKKEKAVKKKKKVK